MAHFSDCGKHCEHPYCRQCDMLPFQCDACNKTYCSQHFKYEDHDCPKGACEKDRRVIVCPLCSAAVPLRPGEDENSVFEQHAVSGSCNPKVSAVAKPNRCPVKGCKEKLTFSNSCNCGTCGLKVCLKHRFEDQHECRTPARSCRSMAGSAAELRAVLRRMVRS
eukprot:TRINITY_DN90777_c0_g1_i1.p2 TRINITY_DN90777_c0_g1~~TRINITY_DN90777_c0_g1_i1.p2  ORF type:complete len:164 (-),score=23.25 TRINITY_DN90777_c0_g1_i1:132-623(-)